MAVVKKALKNEDFYRVKVCTPRIINTIGVRGDYVGALYASKISLILRAEKHPVIFLDRANNSVFRLTAEEFLENEYDFGAILKLKNVAIDDDGYAVKLTSNVVADAKTEVEPVIEPAGNTEGNEEVPPAIEPVIEPAGNTEGNEEVPPEAPVVQENNNNNYKKNNYKK